MRKALSTALLAVALFAAVGVAAAHEAARFFAEGDIAQEIPVPVQVNGKEETEGKFWLSEDGTKLYYEFEIEGLNPVTQAHIHLGASGVNGPIVAFLASYAPSVRGPTFNDAKKIEVEGVITAADLRGPLAGKPLSDLVAAMRAGNTYTNTHTIVNPPGEVRGQIVEKVEDGDKHEDEHEHEHEHD